MSKAKFVLILILKLCIISASYAEKDVDSDSNSVQDSYVDPTKPISNNYYDVYKINDLVFRPILLIEIFKKKHLPSKTEENKFYSDTDDIVNNRRLVRSTNLEKLPQDNNVDYEDDLNLAESSIPFHPLFSIRYRKEVKRRYGRRRIRS